MATLAASGCFSPSFSDGQYECTVSPRCPPGMSCFDGQCVSEPGATADAGDGTNGETPDAASRHDAAPTLDAGSPPARVYTRDTSEDTWRIENATSLFAGASALDPGDIRAAWSVCDFTLTVLCVGTSSGWWCTGDEGANWFSGNWGDFHSGLSSAPVTFADDWAFGTGAGYAVFTQAGLWRMFEHTGPPDGAGGWSLSFVGSGTGWDGSADAPDPNDVVADYMFTDAAGLHWRLWDAAGIEYAASSEDLQDFQWSPPVTAPTIVYPGGPDPGAVRAATLCNGTLYAFTAGGAM